ncbi:MAG: hypothetical protein CYPHOPRED_003564, partial [Cyphobasidiales sp. Tagirdzhanova-0007]
MNSHDSEAGGSVSTVQSAASNGGSLPSQMPGRSYYKYRSVSNAARDQVPTPMSLTQAHLDIREGSARLASLGLAEDVDMLQDGRDDDKEMSTEEGLLLQSQPRHSSQEGYLSTSTQTPAITGAITPSGISVLRQMHEGESLFSMPSNIPLPN